MKKDKKITLGSLFDGAGGFPLAGRYFDIEPIWASEVEALPILVTKKRFRDMKHLGDITKINGANIEPVDIITFGSPCQDLSVAGKREGLAGAKSSLFLQAIRIIKEMRKETNGEYPRYALWENVPGAFSSNRGEDFRQVLEEFTKIKDENITIPRPTKQHKTNGVIYDKSDVYTSSSAKAERPVWTKAGAIMGEDYSIAWRVLDAQYFGVPQRRKRIFLVADFTGRSVAEILFKQKELQWNTKKSKGTWKDTTTTIRTGIDKTKSLIYENHRQEERHREIDICSTVTATYGTGGNNTPLVLEDKSKIAYCILSNTINRDNKNGANGKGIKEDISFTLNTGTPHAVAVFDNYNFGGYKPCEVAGTIRTGQSGLGGGSENLVCKQEIKTFSPQITSVGYKESNIANTQTGGQHKSPTELELQNNLVRRLTPLECSRLQGFPDDYLDDIEIENPTEEDLIFWHKVFEEYRDINNPNGRLKTEKQIRKWLKNPRSDSSEYKMWGNSLAIPCVIYVLRGMVENFDSQ